jgi:hypothetical protein
MPSTICNYKNASNIFHSSFLHSFSIIFPTSRRTSRRQLLLLYTRWAQSSLLGISNYLESAIQYKPKHNEPHLLHNLQPYQKPVPTLRYSHTQCWPAWCVLRRLYVPFFITSIGFRMGYRSLSRQVRWQRQSPFPSLQRNRPLDH